MQLTFLTDTGLGHFTDQFLKAKSSKRPKTYEWYDTTLKQFAPYCRYWPPAPAHVQSFLDSLIERGLSESSIDNYYRGLRSFLNWCERYGHIEHNPIRHVDRPRRPRLLPKAPPPDMVARLLKTMRESKPRWTLTRDIALFCLALDSGARIGELRALAIEDIEDYQILIYGTKVAQERIAVIGDEARRDLNVWLQTRQTLDIPRPLTSVFVSNNRGLGWRTVSQAGIRFRLRYWQDKAGIHRFRFNAFRHAYAVYSLRNKADLLDVQKQLGHSSIKTTAIYTQVVDDGRVERHRRSSPVGNLAR